jgi:hypothetical protein
MAKHLPDESPSTRPPGPAKLTIYRSILDEDHQTGIYFPSGYVPDGKVDLILYFHGLLDRCDGAASDSIQKYWNNKHFPLRELVNSSKKNVILVAPRLADFDKKTRSRLGMEGDDFLKKVMTEISDQVKTAPFNWTGSMNIRNIILTAHSGGGGTMLHLAQTVKAGTVCECWGFDSMYDDLGTTFKGPYGEKRSRLLQDWMEWAATGGKFFLFWTDGPHGGGTGGNVSKFESLLNTKYMAFGRAVKDPTAALAAPNVVIEHANSPKTFASSTGEHCDVPKTFLPDLLIRQGNCLK